MKKKKNMILWVTLAKDNDKYNPLILSQKDKFIHKIYLTKSFLFQKINGKHYTINVCKTKT